MARSHASEGSGRSYERKRGHEAKERERIHGIARGTSGQGKQIERNLRGSRAGRKISAGRAYLCFDREAREMEKTNTNVHVRWTRSRKSKAGALAYLRWKNMDEEKEQTQDTGRISRNYRR